MLALTILPLTLIGLLGFFDQSVFPSLPRNVHLTDTLAVVMIVVIMFRFLT